jgi:lipopolysaccharide biosynthesis glycosyltransferase
VRSDRNPAEFAWTSKAPLLKFVLDNIPEGAVAAYLDSDQFLFSPLEDLYKTFEQYSIVITPHRFSAKDHYKEKLVGKFNAGMIYMRNDENARKCLQEWREQCMKWCYGKLEDGKLGDQMYLDNWPLTHRGVLQIENPGVNAGIDISC